MMDIIGNSWDKVFESEYKKDYFVNLTKFLDAEYERGIVYPPKEQVFNAFKYVDFDEVKVVILGQDPYHGKGQANGMAFAVNEGTRLPPSLLNIYKEIENDLGVSMPRQGSLVGWAKQGVLLLNASLTVRRNEAFSHSNIGWQSFTDAAILSLNQSKNPIVYILWGASATSKKKLISDRHYALSSPHPSPLSAYRGFFGSKPFSKTNDFLAKNGLEPIDWTDVDGYKPASYYVNCKNIQRV